MRGYFGIGVEGLSKPMNAGNLYRSAHAFGASFVFTVASSYDPDIRKSDTSDVACQVPFYSFETLQSMRLPEGCALVGVEITDDAIELPSFRHPRCAAYILGMERGSLSPDLVKNCDYVIKIPTLFSLNLATAGAIVMYDRLISVQQFGGRPIVPGGPIEPIPLHKFGEPVIRRNRPGHKTASSTTIGGAGGGGQEA
jgi:tRNA G18 (ribose-2'-O)-methylase SpoU